MDSEFSKAAGEPFNGRRAIVDHADQCNLSQNGQARLAGF